MDAQDAQFDPNQQMVYVTADGSSYILPSQAFAANASDAGGEELVTYIYSGDGMTAEGQTGDGNIQYLLVSADEAGGAAQQYVVMPQGIDASGSTVAAVAGGSPTVLTLGSSLTPATASDVVSSPQVKDSGKQAVKPNTAGKKAEVIKLDLGKKTSTQASSTIITSAGSSGTLATKGATTAEVKVKGGTARVTILPSTKSPSKTSTDPSTSGVTTIPIKFVSKSDSSEVTTQTITVPVKASPKVSVSVKTVGSSGPAAVVSLPKPSVVAVPSTSTTVATPGSPSKKVGRPRKEEESGAKDALHQIVKSSNSGLISKSKQSPNVIVVPIQISKEMIAAKQSESAAKTPAKVNIGQSPSSSDSETKEKDKGKGKAVKSADETVKEKDTAAKASAKKLAAKPEPKTPAKVAEDASGLAPRRSNRASNISMKLAEWGLLPTSGSKHSAAEDDDSDEEIDDEEEEDEEDDESEEELKVKLPEKRKVKDKDVEDDDDVPLIKTYIKASKTGSPSKSTPSAGESSKEPGTAAATPTAAASKPAGSSSTGASTSTPKVITVSAVSTSKATATSTPSVVKTASSSTTPATATIKVVPAGGGTPATATVKVTGVSTPSGSIKVATVNVQPKKVVTIAKESGSQTPIVIKPQLSSTPSVKSSTPSSGIIKKSSGSSSATPKLLQNKSLMCKPIMMTKATSCNPIRITKATQTDEDIDIGITVSSGGAAGSGSKSIVPLPVPIFVPAPMAMFSTPTPVPMPLPLPIPVPCFIPTTRNSIQAIMKQLQELHDSLPSDPLEADVLKMAEAVAEASEEPGYIIGSEIRPTVNGSGDGTHDESGESGDMSVDVLEMALRMASETGEDHVKAEPDSKSSVKIIEASKSFESSRPPAKRPRLVEVAPPEEDDADSQHEVLDDVLHATATSPLVVASEPLRGPTPAPVLHAPISDVHMHLKYSYGINAWKQWVVIKNAEIEAASAALPAQTTVGRRPSAPKLFKTEILQCSPDELSVALSFFVRELRKPTGEKYQPDSIYYLCLGIQHYLFENGRIDNIFADFYYERFVDALHEVLSTYEVHLNTQGMIVCRVSEEHLWEARQLGAHSPRVLLKTLVYFNTKYFMLQNAESHLALSFSNILKQWKKNSSTADGKPIRSVYLRYNTTGFPQNQQGLSGSGGLDNSLHKRRTFDPTPYEQLENVENPLRCPVKLYEFYLSKCPESIRNRNDVFYLTPEPSCVPASPVWYSAQPLSTEAMNKLLGRIRVVREIQESQLNQAPAALATAAGTTMTIYG